MPNNKRILVPRKREILIKMVAVGATDAQIREAVGRPELDVKYFRDNMNDYKKDMKQMKADGYWGLEKRKA